MLDVRWKMLDKRKERELVSIVVFFSWYHRFISTGIILDSFFTLIFMKYMPFGITPIISTESLVLFVYL
ncbi:hypothetical protein ES705_45636 [subsurface metagenome]